MKKFTIFFLIFFLISCNDIHINSFNNTKLNTLIKDWRADRVFENTKFKIKSISKNLKADLYIPSLSTKILNPIVKFEWGKLINSSSSPGLIVKTNGTSTLYFLTDNTLGYNVYAVNVTSTLTNVNGVLNWQRALNGSFNGSSPTLINSNSKNKLFLISNYYSLGYGKLYCLDADNGYTLAETLINDSLGFKNVSCNVETSITDSCDYVYLASQSGKFYKYKFNWSSSNFELIYTKTISNSNLSKVSCSPVYRPSTGMFYIGTEEGKLYEIHKNGDINYTWDLSNNVALNKNGRILASPVIDDTNGILIVPCGGYLFRIDLNTKIVTQSPLLEIRQNILSFYNDTIGPEKKFLSTFSSTLSKDAKVSDSSLEIDYTYGFSKNDYIRIKSKPVYAYTEITDDIDPSKSSVKISNLYPQTGQTPAPVKGDIVEMAPDVIRYNPVPIVVGGNTTGFTVGKNVKIYNNDGVFIKYYLVTGDYIKVIDNNNNNNTYISQITVDGTDPNKITLTTPLTFTAKGGEKWEKITNEVLNATANTITLGDSQGFSIGNRIKIVTKYGVEYNKITNITGNIITLEKNLTVLPVNTVGAKVEIVNSNPYYGNLFTSALEPLGDIKSSPIIKDGRVYIVNNNTLFELNYLDNSFNTTAKYCIMQAARIDNSGINLQGVNQSNSPKIVTDPINNKNLLITIDEDKTKKFGTFINRFNLPLDSNNDSLNDYFLISDINSDGEMPYSHNFLFTNQITIEDGTKGYWGFWGSSNGIIYGLSLINTWN